MPTTRMACTFAGKMAISDSTLISSPVVTYQKMVRVVKGIIERDILINDYDASLQRYQELLHKAATLIFKQPLLILRGWKPNNPPFMRLRLIITAEPNACNNDRSKTGLLDSAISLNEQEGHSW